MDKLEDYLGVLSLSQAWLPACLLTGMWCAWRARQKAYSVPLFAGLGFLLGPGVMPVTWLATQEDLQPMKASGTGFSPNGARLLQDQQFWSWARLYQGFQQCMIGLVFGVGGGLLATTTQALTHYFPKIFEQTLAQYEAGINPGAGLEIHVRILWCAAMLIGPSLVYVLFTKLPRPRVMDRLWIAFARRVDTEQWRQLVPGHLQNLAEPLPEDPEPLKAELEQQILACSPVVVPAFLLVLFVGVFLFVAGGAHFYYWWANSP